MGSKDLACQSNIIDKVTFGILSNRSALAELSTFHLSNIDDDNLAEMKAEVIKLKAEQEKRSSIRVFLSFHATFATFLYDAFDV